MSRPAPYVPKLPTDLIRAEDWNELQVQAHEQILRHRHYHGTVDIDANMPHSIALHFETQAHVPVLIKLFLRASRFSRAFYTELGGHQHATSTPPVSISHSHGHSLSTAQDSHTHRIRIGQTGGISAPGGHSFDGRYPAALGGWTGGSWVSLVVVGLGTFGEYEVGQTNHNHAINGGILEEAPAHSHEVEVEPTGAKVAAANELKEFASGMRFLVDNEDRTEALRAILGWEQLGDGTSTHPLVNLGTGVLDITALVPAAIGTHELRLEVGSGGGRIAYDVLCE